MDQGAIKSIILAITPNRYLAGKIEKICKKKISDRTNYINMLTNSFIIKNINLINIKYKIFYFILTFYYKYNIYLYKNNKITNFIYPVIKYPKKNNIKIINFKNKYNKILKEKLLGIKGQYLIFTNNKVFNINNHLGYSINITIF